MGWGSSWDKIIPPMQELKPEIEPPEGKKQKWPTPNAVAIAAMEELNKASEETKALINSKGYQDSLKEGMEAVKRAANKFPTHDPYTNPGAFLYYECNCGQVLDPKVKSFASLNNHASEAGWKIRWGAASYVPYCPKCVVEKGIE